MLKSNRSKSETLLYGMGFLLSLQASFADSFFRYSFLFECEARLFIQSWLFRNEGGYLFRQGQPTFAKATADERCEVRGGQFGILSQRGIIVDNLRAIFSLAKPLCIPLFTRLLTGK